jgi:ABC-2 type transport system permease protein
MNKTYLIFQHEFLNTIKRAGFIIMTMIVPIGALAAIGIVKLTANVPVPAEVTIPAVNSANMIIPGVFSLLLALALMFGATSLVRGLGEEKESSLIEVLFSSVSVRQLLVGKVLALGAAGLLQVVVWLVSLPLLLNMASSSFGGLLSRIQIPTNFLMLGIIYFILGYLLFAVLSIGLGSISANATEAGQLSMLYTLTCFIPLWFVALLIFFPGSPIWVVLSIFPITAPIQIMVRLGVTGVPPWQILVSIGVLCLAIVAGMSFAIKIFRLQMLKSGKRPRIAQIIRDLRGG